MSSLLQDEQVDSAPENNTITEEPTLFEVFAEEALFTFSSFEGKTMHDYDLIANENEMLI